MCWLIVGLLLGEPGSRCVHVLILLLSNQVENKSGVSGWLGKRGKHFPCFPSWSISVSKNIHVFCYTIVVTLVWWCVVILGGYYVLAKVCPQPFKIVVWHALLGNAFLENVYRGAGLVFRGHDPVFFVLLVVSYPKWKLGWLNQYGVGFTSCSLGLLLDYVSNFVLCWGVFETRAIGCTILLLTKVCTLAFKISC